MTTALIKNLARHVGTEVTVQGWLYNTRSSGKIQFLIIRDGTGLVQCVLVKKEVGEELFELAGGLTQESSLKVTGMVQEESRSAGGFELQVTCLEVVGIAAEYPITNK